MNKTHCKNCSYFFGKEGIHCAAHPYGKELDSCSDWQQKELDLQQDKLINANIKTKSLSYPKIARYLVVAGAALLVGHQLYQKIPPAIRADKNYDNYQNNCEIFIERASKAGTTGIARIELARGVNWLEANYSVESFEYRDLKENLDYLKKQPENTIMPGAITGSISSDIEKIKENQLKLQISFWEDLYGGIFRVVLISSIILILIAILEEYLGS